MTNRYFGTLVWRGEDWALLTGRALFVDDVTMWVEIKKYVVVHDCGRVINPLIVEGQIHGGVAQGIGNAFFEKLLFDKEAQLLNATLADYLIPTSLDVPHMTLTTRSPPRP